MPSSLRTVLVFGVVLAFAPAASAQTTALFFNSQSGDYIGGGVTHTYQSGDGTFTAAANYSGGVSATVIGPSYSFWWYLDFATGGQQPLTTGTLYTAARRFPFAALNAMSIAGSGRGCNTLTGRFLVREAVYSGNTIVRFAVDFEQHCENAAAGLFGSFRFNSTIADLTPFGGDYPHVRLTVTPPANGSVTGGGITCGSAGAACTADFGSSTPVTLTATPDSGYLFAGWIGDCSGGTVTTVTVNAAKDCGVSFQPVTTTSRTLLVLDSQTGDTAGQGQYRVFSPQNSTWTIPTMSSSGSLSLTVDGVSATSDDSWPLSFAAMTNGALEQGNTYTHALQYQTAFTPGIQVGHGCGTATGRFTVLELVRATDGTVLRLAIDFEQHCNDAGPGLFGSLRYNSTVGDVTPFGGSYPAYSLTVTPAADGIVTGTSINCGGVGPACSSTYGQPTAVALTATPNSGYLFVGWSGDCTGGSATNVFVNSAKTCAAVFEPILSSGPRTLARWTSQTIDYGTGPQTDAIGHGADGVFSPQTTVWNAQSPDGVSVSVSVTSLSGTSTSTWGMQFGPPPGQALTAGMTYVHAIPFGRSTPIMSITGASSSFCSASVGRFFVREIAFNSDKSLARLAIDFEAHCGLAVPAFIGVVRYNSTIASLDAFDGDYNVYRVTIAPISHGIVTGSGLDCGVGHPPCIIQPGIASTPSLSAVPDTGYAFAGWTGDCHGGATITLFVNGPKQCTALFEPSPPMTARTFLRFTSDAGDQIARGRSELYTLSNSAWSTPLLGSNGGSFQATVTGPNDTGEDQWVLLLSAPSGQSLQVGTRYDITSTSFVAGAPSITFFGAGYCSAVGNFTIRELASDANHNLQRIAVDFELHCGTITAPAVRGTLEYGASVDIPSFGVDRSSLQFAALTGPGGSGPASVVSVGAPQALHVIQGGTIPMPWSVAVDQPWLSVTPLQGSGSSAVMVSINVNAIPAISGNTIGHITIATPANALAAGPIAVSLAIFPATLAVAPFGSFDTPAAGSIVSGSIAVTGWALDDVEVTGVRIMRSPVAGEGSGPVFVGNAALIDGARPDVLAAYIGYPRSSRGGWGYLLLTNMLPNQGNGTFTLYAYADDADGHTTLLGTKTITCDNAHATAPFGAIDTPGQGDVVSGVVPNFGWVLSPGLRRADPPGGGTVTVYVDGAPVGSPGGWAARDDLTALFPVAQYSGVDMALGVYGLDTTALANGVHTISWAVTDNTGVTSGIGSRFFTVSNGAIRGPVAANQRRAAARAQLTAVGRPGPGMLLGRRGFDPYEPLEYYIADVDGVITIDAQELDRIELHLEPGATGVMRTPQGERPLPAGARIDPSTGVFTWAPAAGFVGRYELMLGSQRVRIILRAK